MKQAPLDRSSLASVVAARALCFLIVLCGASIRVPAAEGPPRVLRPGETPQDRRLGPLKKLDGYFPFEVPPSADAWAARRERVERQILVAAGLWPLPEKRPPRAVVHGRVERPPHAGYPGYTVERVILESYPGHFVTGSLYRPAAAIEQAAAGQPAAGQTAGASPTAAAPRRYPGVICPHGHLPDGRFSDIGRKAVREQIALGAERFEAGGRNIEQARAVQLARMGCVVFNYDMLGYADSQQISFELAHKFAKQRPEFEGEKDWGLFSAQAEQRAQSVFGLQTYNSLTALDWLCSLPDVDSSRIAMTGMSGGGTQTMILAAIEPRVAVSFPAVMVSTAMQGGCTCENASLLRVETGNIEFAALCAPRPQGMTAANDWTKEIETKGLPELKKLYALVGAKDQVMGKALVQFPHNYNYVSREVMYQFFNDRLRLGLETPVVEEDYQPLDRAELSVWDDAHPQPQGGPEHERSLLATIARAAQRQLDELTPRDAAGLARFRRVVCGAVDVIVGRGLPAADELQWDLKGEDDRGEWMQFSGWLRNAKRGEELPIVFLHPYAWRRRVAIWLRPEGKAGLFLPTGDVRPEIGRLLAAGVTVVGVDCLYQGELSPDGKPLDEARNVENPREFAGYTLGYNHALAAERAHDVLAAISFCRSYQADKPDEIILIATDGAAPWAAAALAQAGPAVDRAAIDTAGFRFASLRSIRDVNLLPAVVKYGDLPGLVALAAGRPLWLGGETEPPPLVKAAFDAAGASDRLAVHAGPPESRIEALLVWLLR